MLALLKKTASSPKHRGLVLHTACSGAVFLWCLSDTLWRSSLGGTLSLAYLCYCAVGTLILLVAENADDAPAEMHFGFARLRTLLTYANACMLVFFSLTTAIEGLQAVFMGHQYECASHLLFLQIAVHVSFEAFLAHRVPPPVTTSPRAGAAAEQPTKPLPIRAVRRCIPSLLALGSCFTGYEVGDVGRVDGMCALASAYFCLHTSWPLMRLCCNVLLQKAPGKAVRATLDKACREAQSVKGVLEVADQKAFCAAPGDVVATMRVRVRRDAHCGEVLAPVRAAFEPFVSQLCVQVDTDSDTLLQHMALTHAGVAPPPPPQPSVLLPAPPSPLAPTAELMSFEPLKQTPTFAAPTGSAGSFRFAQFEQPTSPKANESGMSLRKDPTAPASPDAYSVV
eukprot:Rhum_TRINITY_DN7666_c0_g1::Rhum_TRINITY_DN7666_c0_g1_i1::g.24125::m.24125/K14693/SLC30A6, ZNT6; solute carrier family 30 (zinc transporter), member 6